MISKTNPYYIFLILIVFLFGCSTTESISFNVGSDEIQVTEIAVKKLEIDEEGDRWFSGKAKVKNRTNRSVAVDVYIQGIDAEGFEIIDIWLEGRLDPNESKVLTNREFTSETNYTQIVEWRLRSVDIEDTNGG